MKSNIKGKNIEFTLSMAEADQLRASLMNRKRRWFDIFIPSTKILRRFSNLLDHALPQGYAYA